ncbi:tRNA pseudouridine synthase A [Chlorella sorokiniana]|uniref:tRNA pseudouridine synthase A n=1 Tax=Chlorella sorokiniana TaxID=3076 RepID=A0A2P6THF5_CHLSO|nr:tRNA pseudouridine synthase A [Chlorella sorokiniana]|eukprot:PRW33719.1 tRNA pseudouridine synthase A [Chlorella sorokiniana]
MPQQASINAVQSGQAQQQHPAADQRQRGRQPHERATWKVCLGYYGPAFGGWQFVKGQEGQSVQEAVQAALQQLLDARRAVAPAAAEGARHANGHLNGSDGSSSAVPHRTIKRLRRPQPVVLAAAGRTDRSVHALGQVLSFYTWDDGVTQQDILSAISAARPGLLRAWHAERVPRSFHATFSAHWRRYLYLLPLRTPRRTAGTAGEAASTVAAAAAGTAEDAPAAAASLPGGRMGAVCAGKALERLLDGEAAAVDAAPDVDPARVASLLAQLEGRELDYAVFARDTPAGKDCRCCLLRARAWAGRLPDAQRTPVLAVELLGNRFLRRMVRVLAATAVREAVPQGAVFGPPCGAAAGAAGAAAAAADQAAAAAATPHEQAAAWDARALLRAVAIGDRSLTAPAAPAEGLCFLEAGYGPLPA